jgi:calcium-dependent protein kinase
MTVVVKVPNDSEDIGDFTSLQGKMHPNVVRVFELYHSPGKTFVVMECCAGGDLFGVLEDLVADGRLTYNFIAAIFRHAVTGVKYIHDEFKCSHNDIKPENILLARKPASPEDVPRAMIADFGCMTTLSEAAVTGDPRYRAPECFVPGFKQDFLSDVWSLGMVLYEMLSGGCLPFIYRRNISGWGAFANANGGMLAQRMSQALQRNEQVQFNQIGNARGRDLLSHMLCPRQVRWTLDKVLQHSFFDLVQEAPAAMEAELCGALQSRGIHRVLEMALLNLVASKVQGPALEPFRQAWSRYDRDNSGVLDIGEFKALINELGSLPNGVSESDVFNMADVDGSGKINFNEFVAAIFSQQVDAEAKERALTAAFNDLAGGGSGHVSVSEFERMFEGIEREKIHALFRDIDSNGSGQISLDEFKAYMDKE